MEKPIKRGRGRPKKDEKLERRTVYLPPESWAKIDVFGTEWLRQVIKRAKGPKTPGDD